LPHIAKRRLPRHAVIPLRAIRRLTAGISARQIQRLLDVAACSPDARMEAIRDYLFSAKSGRRRPTKIPLDYSLFLRLYSAAVEETGRTGGLGPIAVQALTVLRHPFQTALKLDLGAFRRFQYVVTTFRAATLNPQNQSPPRRADPKSQQTARSSAPSRC
jgi:hypothetical protein